MNDTLRYALLADGVLTLHVVFVLFVVVTLPLLFIGKRLGWQWVRHRRLRILHLVCIGIVVIQAWLGVVCPLTTLEMHFRALAGETTYPGSFIAHWMGRLLYYQAPAWVFTAVYSVFGLAVITSWFYVRPHPR